MKTLVLQLARLGDIYQTWPVLRGLKRQDPEGEIHVLTRNKFSGALNGLDVVSRHWVLDSREIILPLIDEQPDFDASAACLTELTESLKAEGFDQVLNLSFSPLSSFVASAVAGPGSEVKGYTRFDDGYLDIPDDGSAYFYAQVGPGRANRLHVTDLFAFVAGVELLPEDWRGPRLTGGDVFGIGENAIVIHVGASQSDKTLGWPKWASFVRGLLACRPENVVLIGSKNEEGIAERICAAAGERQPINLVGLTNLSDLFEVIGHSKILIGGDSGPVHIASLVGTPVLQLSFPSVCLWETGPKSKHSRILEVDDEGSLPSDALVRETVSLLDGRESEWRAISVDGPCSPYRAPTEGQRAFQWELVQALYLGAEFPVPRDGLFFEGIRRLSEANELAIEQIQALRQQKNSQTAAAILDRADEIIGQIGRMIPDLGPMIRWFQTEKLRIGPMPIEQLTDTTEGVYRRFADVIDIYREDAGSPSAEGGAGHDDIVLG